MKTRFALALLLLAAGSAVAGEPRDFGRGSWPELRRQHDGRPTIIHFWGLTCGPCLVELPEWGRFAQAHKGLDFVMIGADPVPEDPARLLGTLAKSGLEGTESWRFADPFTERLEYEIDPNWRGELPFTILLGRDGSTDAIRGTVDFGELRSWIERQDGSNGLK